jgi:hypothetical protein
MMYVIDKHATDEVSHWLEHFDYILGVKDLIRLDCECIQYAATQIDYGVQYTYVRMHEYIIGLRR